MPSGEAAERLRSVQSISMSPVPADERIKVIKDIAAAAVGVCILIWVYVLAFEGWEIVNALRAG